MAHDRPSEDQQRPGPADPSALVRRGRLALEQGRFAAAEEALSLAVEQDIPRLFVAWHLLGRARLRLGRLEAARDCFEEALRRAPRFSPARLGRVEANLLLGEVEAAAGEVAALAGVPEAMPRAILLDVELAFARGLVPSPIALDRLPGGGDGAADDRLAAELLSVAARDSEAAIPLLLTAVSDHLASAPAWRALAWARLQVGDRERAIATLRVARELDEGDSIAPYALSRLAGESFPLPPLAEAVAPLQDVLESWQTGASQQTLAEIAALLAARPHLVPLRLLQIRSAEEAGELWQAALGYGALLDSVGALPAVSAGLAAVAETLGAHSLAACAAQAALALRPSEGSLWFLLGVAEAGRDDPERALEAFRRAHEAGFDAARIELKRGDLLFEQMRIDDALRAYRRAVELDPEAAVVIRPFALASLTADQQRELGELLALHSAAHPEDVDTLYALATLDLRQGRLEAAERRFRRLSELAPGHIQVHYNLGQLYLRLGRSEEGRAELDRFATLRQRADDEWERHNRAHRRRLAAEEARRTGQLAEQIALLEESVRDETADLADWGALVDAYLAADRWADARRASLSILSATPADETALDGWRRAAEQLGVPGEAAAAAARLALLRDGCSRLVVGEGRSTNRG